MADYHHHHHNHHHHNHHTLAPRPAGSPAAAIASASSASTSASAGHRDGRRDGFATPGDRRSSGYETGESSNAARQQRETVLYHGKILNLHDDDDDGDMPLNFSPSGDIEQQQQQHHDDGYAPREERPQRKNKHRISGGFLLQNAAAGARVFGFRRQRGHQSLGHSQSSAGRDAAPRSSSGSDRGQRQSSMPTRHSLGDHPPVSMDDSTTRDPRRFSDSHSSPQRPSMDLDSSQVVHMALNLSESRRLAARRNIARATPPRLAPLPDASSSGNLKQHLQQQRKSSRGGGPKPFQEPPPMIPSGGSRLGNPYQPTFDASHDVQYTYQCSSSTLARAQKAKEHLELLAQYRRLLEVLPPLKPGFDRPTSGNPPGSPVGTPGPANFGTHVAPVTLGRQYNPLQYIRNRKVRARERQTIDGERQGFGDVDCVKSWVDTVSSHQSLAGTSLLQDKTSIPLFPSAEELYNQESPEPLAKMASRARRPRADWFMEPCDMIADAYWLEKDGHKHLIEDRHWRKICPAPAAELQSPMSREGDDSNIKASPFSLKPTEQNESILDDKEPGLSKVRTDLSHGSAKERAKQKLQTIKGGFHHRHNNSVHGHDLLRLKRGSVSEFSDSENEVGNEGKKKTRPKRKGTISSNSNDLLQKQMLEMLAKEAREKELDDVAELPEGKSLVTPEQKPSKPPSRFGSRKGSLAEYSDSDPRSVLGRARLGSPVRHGLYANNLSMGSVGNYSSNPNSPDLQPTRSSTIEQITNTDLSPPWSRSGSPVRNPLDKIKRIIRDKSAESVDSQPEDGDEDRDSRLSRRHSVAPTGSTTTLSRRQSSPGGKLMPMPMPLPTIEGSKHHRANSKRLRAEEAVGLRSMFKGPRIDTVIRDGVYKLGDKLGDKIWKKDGSSESPELETTDESDTDRIKDRRGTSPFSLSRRTSNRTQDGRPVMQKHFLDSMPQFHHAPDYQHLAAVDGVNQGRRASRFDLLKAPQIDVRSVASSRSPPPGARKSRLGDSDVSESESFPGSVPEGVRDADRRLNSAIALAKLDQAGRSMNRHWSIADGGIQHRATLSKREVARMKALILSSGIKAMEIRRRAYEQHKPFSRANLAANKITSKQEPAGIAWSDIAKLGPKQPGLAERQVAFYEVYPLAAQTLGIAIQAWGQRWQISADRFTNKTSPELRKDVWDVRTRLADDLSELTRKAADEADETSRDLALGQPLKIKHVVDTIEKMLRRRRRRFRWLRRGMWLTVEWLLVGFMWYVWFVVMILRIFLGIGKGVLGGVKWLLWL
ncbi:hypothetical protein PT974_06119 [Cladobotryum mycophilum]|uniref:Uncharacterized protein n=1 Tax=Cladobotryum mycophilum TaxID=491253 RepID=A0ABR0SKY1_9HYPO